MLKTLLGIILLLVPFLLLSRFKDKKLGFAYILGFLTAFQLAVAIITQAFGVFRWSFIIIINIAVDLIVLTRINFKELKDEIKTINLKNIDWALILVIIVLFIELFSVHYDYTGKVTTIDTSYKEVKNMRYTYPYFSDEWVSVSLVQYSITSGKLPIANPSWYNNFFPNLELPFHSFVSELILLLGLNPLTNYSLLALFSGILICILVYFILRINNIGKLVSSITCLSVPYIVNGANLPGLWTFIPLIMGVICLLLGFLFISADKRKMFMFAGLLTLIFYPPLFVIYTVGFLFYFAFSDMPKKTKRNYILFYLFVIMASASVVGVFSYLKMDLSITDFVFHFIRNKMIYPTLTANAIPNFSIYQILPIPIILLAVFGGFKIFKKKLWLAASVIAGLLYWWFYSFMLWRFVIEYERIVFTTAVLMTVLAGFGLFYLSEYLKEIEAIKKYNLVKIGLIIVLALFLFLAFSYTQRDNWKELKLYSVIDDARFSPASPANQYLHEDDLKLFENISGKRFLSLPWKGLVIGVATENYPLETKESTITNQIVRHSEFVRTDCANKTRLAKENGIDYVYSWEFNCTGFKEIGRSEEDLVLYEAER